ncbi:hypothetical protein PQG02_29380 [Nostoc sp. UHCC 0926]|nr:hypothetical protein PQG02_29380 [Nostoc sp. UHCC 0926]
MKQILDAKLCDRTILPVNPLSSLSDKYNVSSTIQPNVDSRVHPKVMKEG